MKRYFLLIVIIFIFSFTVSACKRVGIQASNPQIDANKDIPKDTLIKLQRTRCFGTCPAYELIIYNDGKVTFKADYIAGKSKEEKPALIESKISQEKVKEIIREFQKANFFDFSSDEYSHGKCTTITDMPSAMTFIRYNGKEKSVDHYHGCDKAPKALTQLEDRIDELVNTKQWLK